MKMLYNPKWSKTRKAKPSLKGFIAWLMKQSPKKRYNYEHWDRCAVAQYAHSHNKTFSTLVKVHTLRYWDHEIAEPMPHTFGAALRRARALEKT
jgi:hypothetical protein